MRIAIPLLAAVLAALLGPAAAQAHRVNVFAYVEGGTCRVEAYFRRSRPARDATVEVLDAAGRELLRGRTDDRGRFSFPVPETTDLRIVVDAGLGHRAEYLLSASEIRAAEGGAGPPGDGPAPAPVPPDAGAPARTEAGCDPAAVAEAVDRTLDRRLAPVYALVSEIRKERSGISAAQVVAGLGYIAGIFGVAAYAAARRKGA